MVEKSNFLRSIGLLRPHTQLLHPLLGIVIDLTCRSAVPSSLITICVSNRWDSSAITHQAAPARPLLRQAEMTSERPARRPSGWKSMPFIIANETFERVASQGTTANLTVYLVTRFGMHKVEAASATNVFFGTSNFAPLLGAFISDAYWGRFRTLACASISSFLGMLFLTLTASVPQLRPPNCTQSLLQAGQCTRPTNTQLGVLFFSLALLALGTGGVRPCSLPFGIDQFDRTTEKGQKSLNSYFNWYYCAAIAGIAVGLTVVVYVQSNISWSLGFAIPTGFMLLSIILFFLGTGLYVFVPPEGSVFSGIARAIVASFRKRYLVLPSANDVQQQELLFYDPPTESFRVSKIPLTQQFRFLNKAAIKCDGELNADGSPTNPWRLCSIQQVEEVKCLIRIVPITISGVISLVAVVQQWTFTVLQALEMDRHLGPHFQIPAGSIVSIVLFTMTLFLPIYDRVIIPAIRTITKRESGITLLQRQGVGIVFGVLSMIVAGLLEHKRRASALSHDGVSPMSVLWLAPQLVLVGLQEAFNDIGQIEFYIKQFPDHMQSLAGSFYYVNLGGANYLCSLLVAIVQVSTGGDGRPSWLDDDINVGRLDYFYYLIAVMGVVNLLFFLLCAHYYHYKGVKDVIEDGNEARIMSDVGAGQTTS